MKLYRTTSAIVLEADEQFYKLPTQDWDHLLNEASLHSVLEGMRAVAQPISASEFGSMTHLPPIGTQEVWAAGVTYFRSKIARMEESKDAGGGTFYDKVYDAARPEIFFKATPNRVVGTDGKVRIRQDSTWDVPEPELTLCVSASGHIVGYTVGNDMSSRSIEGENPLYLPQAKVYAACAGLGPCVYVTNEPLPPTTRIALSISRGAVEMFAGQVSISQIKRSFDELVSYLFRENEFPQGVFLMTGTGIVPPNDFTLQSGDRIQISIEGIGTLINWVA